MTRYKVKRYVTIAMSLLFLFSLLFVFLLKDTGHKKKPRAERELKLTLGECIYSVNALLGEDLTGELPFAMGDTQIVGEETEKLPVGGSTEGKQEAQTQEQQEKRQVYDKESVMNGEALAFIIGRLGLESSAREAIVTKHASDSEIDRAEWLEVLREIAASFNMQETIQETTIPIFDVMEGENIRPVVTDEKVYTYFAGDNFLKRDCTADVMVRNENIIFAGDIHAGYVKYENVLIEKTEGESITVRLNGDQRIFIIKGLTQKLENTMADIEMERQGEEMMVTTLKLKRESISGKLLAVSPEGVELEGFGKINFSAKCRYYSAYQNYDNADRDILMVGSEQLSFIVADKQICAVVIKQEMNVENIRVLLKSTGYESLFHESASIQCQGSYKLSYYTRDDADNIVENVSEHAALETVEVTPEDDRLKEGRIRITPVDENTKTIINSLSRNGSAPKYRGTIEIACYEGKIVIINDVSLEEYLYAVVPSEMPSSYGVEALKVQAVCARSYAVSHLNDGKLSRYGAQIDDSTDYQVYNNTEETENAIAAVTDTAGQILTCDGEVANTYFFATSCGSTTDAAIWGSGDLSYIHGKLLNSGTENINLTDNEQFRKFITSDFDSFDQGTAWYRWNMTMSYDRLSACINEHLEAMCRNNPDKILLRQGDGSYISTPVATVGNIKNITVEKRLTGGVIDELVIEGDAAVIKVIKQSTIRNLINPYGVAIHKNDGSEVSTFSALPSAFFTVEKTEGGMIFYGGGFGHGAGMSQTAVKNMIAENMSYEEILKFFYTGVEIGYSARQAHKD